MVWCNGKHCRSLEKDTDAGGNSGHYIILPRLYTALAVHRFGTHFHSCVLVTEDKALGHLSALISLAT